MSGHLFITRGDLTELACDAILVPSGIGPDGEYGHLGHVTWRKLLGRTEQVDPTPTARERVVRASARRGRRAIWVGHTGEDGREPWWYADALEQFVRGASAQDQPRLRARPFSDPRPVVGVPLVGSGKGGMSHRKGELMLETVGRLAAAARTHDCDVVLVLATREAYAAAQQVRDRLAGFWDELGSLTGAGDRLAEYAQRGGLVVFAGAGASIGAGGPSWTGLLRRLARKAKMRPAEVKELRGLDARDAAAVLEQRLGSHERLRDEVVALTTLEYVSVLHQLLASLPVDEVVTTNYDDCLERSFRAAGRSLKVLPHEPVSEQRGWIVKLHGSVPEAGKPPRDIVLSRDDYLRFEGDYAALAGLVQALLLTRHMLFVGYSLNDDNFHRMVHQVRQVTRGNGDVKLATALSPKQGGLMEGVWQADIDYVTAGTDARPDDPRRIAMLVDYIGARSAQAGAHLLDTTYGALFTAEEEQLRIALAATRAAADKVGYPVGDAVTAALDGLGGR